MAERPVEGPGAEEMSNVPVQNISILSVARGVALENGGGPPSYVYVLGYIGKAKSDGTQERMEV